MVKGFQIPKGHDKREYVGFRPKKKKSSEKYLTRKEMEKYEDEKGNISIGRDTLTANTTGTNGIRIGVKKWQ